MFLPYYDENPTLRRPYLNWALLAVNIVVFLACGLSPGYERIVAEHGFTPAHPELPDALTSMFLHAGLLHLAGNMLYLWIFGDNVEDTLGHGLYLPFYLLAGGAAVLLQWAAGPGSAVPMVGASGAIAGVLGFYLVYFPWRRVRVLYFFGIIFGSTRIPALWVILFWFVFQVGAALLEHGQSGGGVAYWAHVGGFLFGLGAACAWKLFVALPEERLAPTAGRSGFREPVGPPLLPVPLAPAAPAAAARAAATMPAGAGLREANQALAATGADELFLATFLRAARVYGESRLTPEHHLRAINLLLRRGRLTRAAEAQEKFLRLFPKHPAVGRARYGLGMLYLHRLGRPGRGLKFLHQAVSQPDAGYPLEAARAELEALQTNLARITAGGKTPKELRPPCAVLRQTDEPLDYIGLARDLARMTGRTYYDLLNLMRSSHGLIAMDLDRRQAISLADYLQGLGIPVVVLDRTQFVPLPEPDRATEVELLPDGLRWRSARAGETWRWEELELAAAGWVTTTETRTTHPALGPESLAEEYLHRPPTEFQRREHPLLLGRPAGLATLPHARTESVSVEQPAIQLVRRETGARVQLLGGRTAFGTLATGQRRDATVLPRVAQQLLESVDCRFSRPGLEQLAAAEPAPAGQPELAFPSEAAFGLYATTLYYRKKYG